MPVWVQTTHFVLIITERPSKVIYIRLKEMSVRETFYLLNNLIFIFLNLTFIPSVFLSMYVYVVKYIVLSFSHNISSYNKVDIKYFDYKNFFIYIYIYCM